MLPAAEYVGMVMPSDLWRDRMINGHISSECPLKYWVIVHEREGSSATRLTGGNMRQCLIHGIVAGMICVITEGKMAGRTAKKSGTYL